MSPGDAPKETPKAEDEDPALGKSYTATLEALEAASLSCSESFACSGTIPLDELEGLALYYRSTTEDAAATAISLPISDADAQALASAGQESPFGRGKKTVVDPSYRQARELKPPNFALSVDPILTAGVLATIRQRLDLADLSATVHKLNVYSKDGFFKPHRDTPHRKTHIGTITLCLPSSFTGGELVVRHRGDEVTYTWADEVSDALAWTFLYSNCEHEVLPVASGTRVTVAYDVFAVESARATGAEPALAKMSALLSSLADDAAFLPEGGVLAFGLQHDYPCDRYDRSDRAYVAKQLKGEDALWLDAVRASGLMWDFGGVYDADPDYFGDNKHKATYKAREFEICDEFTAMEDVFLEDGIDELGNSKSELYPDKHVAWVTEPGSWGGRNSYVSYGNEHQAETAYVSVALCVELPPAGKRSAQKAAPSGAHKDKKRKAK